MKKTAQLFYKSNFLSGFANLKSSAAKTKAELTFSIQVFIIFANQREHIFLLYTILSCNFLRSNNPLKKVHAFWKERLFQRERMAVSDAAKLEFRKSGELHSR